MTDSRQVYPRKPLEATRKYPDVAYPWALTLLDGDDVLCSDAEFAAAFVSASLVDDIISAAREVAKWSRYVAEAYEDAPKALDDAIDHLIPSEANLSAALSAFDAAVQTEA